jgi:UDP-glucose 4-epimerase
MSDKVLITGGLGYVGGRVAKALIEGTQLNVVVTTRGKNVSRPDWLARGEVLSLDMAGEGDLASVCQGVRCIVHLAAANEIESAADPEGALIVNGLGTLKLLRAAEKAGVERFIYFSTAHVYGAPLRGVITESVIPRPVHPYAITHKVAEDFVLAAHASRKITGVVLRLSNGFGAPTHAGVNRWTLIANDLCRQAVVDGKLVLRSSGLQKRDFITLADVGRAVIHFIEQPAAVIGDGLFNLGGENALRIIDMAQAIADHCEKRWGVRPPIERPAPGPTEKEDVLDYRIDKLKSIGFTPQISFAAEIDQTLQLCRETWGGSSGR